MRLLLTADPLIPVPPVTYGGIERIVDSLLHHHRAAGHEVALLAHPASKASADARFGWPSPATSSPLGTLRNALALRSAVRSFVPDIVHSFSRLAYLLPVLPTRQPVVMSYQRHTGGRGVGLAARLGGASLAFTGCSEFINRQGREAGGKWSAIPNFVDLSKLDFIAAVPADAPLVFLSRLDDIKGPDTAIAIARAAGRRLIIAGNVAPTGPQRDFFERAVRPHLGHGGIEFIGEVDDTAKNHLLGQAAALLVPIRWDEPFGIVFAEALACGTPIISCPRGALPEIVEPGLTGFLIPSDDINAGADAVSRLGELDRPACRRVAEQRYNLSVVAEQYLALYRTLALHA